MRCAASSEERASPASAAPSENPVLARTLMAGAAMAGPLLLQAQAAMATDGAYGILEGRTAALIHPAVMLGLFTATGYAGYLGWQWRRTREVGEEIREMKKSLPAVGADGVRPPSAMDSQVEAKEKERKELIAGNFRDKHALWGSVLLASGVGIAIEGCANTFIRTGKLFPGPHLFAGASIVFLWAMAAALTPAMQKGDQNARNAHIALNALNMGLFIWQVPTGLEIVGKVFQFTQWP